MNARLYRVSGMCEVKCECGGRLDGELVKETDDAEIHIVECDCGNSGEVVRETTLGGETHIPDGFERF